ncbi:MAG: ROK family protein [Acidobacteriota bacterium]
MSASANESLIGAIEAGGTKFVCAVGRGPGEQLLARASFPTGGDPTVLLDRVAGWLTEQEAHFGRMAALGIASFGPVDLDPASPTWGYITSTPKAGWQYTDLVGGLRQRLRDLPVGFDTDVNGAALGEQVWGAARGLADFVYLTIGTGIGGGGMVGGQMMHGLLHPEMGHMLLPRLVGDDFIGICPFHGDCWEGLCTGPAMNARAGAPAETLAADHPAWDLETEYIARALANIIFVLSPRRIIIGGSVRKAGHLGEERFFAQVRERVRRALKGYLGSPSLAGEIDQYIVPPVLGDDAGVCGAIALGQRAL